MSPDEEAIVLATWISHLFVPCIKLKGKGGFGLSQH